MKASTSYLYLLRSTPFFTALTTQQLSWVIKMSREWEAEAGTVVHGEHSTEAADDVWILLDGAWQLEIDGRRFPAGHADPGKWFSARDVADACRLVTTEASYVMQITRVDLDAMLAQGFTFGRHMAEGLKYYASIFATASVGR